MPSDSSPVDPDVVRKIAALARLSVPEAELPAWAEQLARILSYIDQLKGLPDGEGAPPQADATPLRPDEPLPGAGRLALEQNASLLHDHGVVPRVVAAAKEGFRAMNPSEGAGSKDPA